MNIKVIRNFSMMALMLGAMFVLTSKQAQAQNQACEQQCSIQMNACIASACPGGCSEEDLQGIQQCEAEVNQCMSNCGY